VRPNEVRLHAHVTGYEAGALPVYGMRTLEDQVDRSLLNGAHDCDPCRGVWDFGDAASDGRALWSDVIYCRTACQRDRHGP